MGDRYTVNGNVNMDAYEIIDLKRSNGIDGDYVICEVRDEDNAELIVRALNLLAVVQP